MNKINELPNDQHQLKLWFAWTNTGDWGGITEYCCIAETKEEAEEKMGLAKYKENPHYYVGEPYAMTGKDIIAELVTCGGTKGFELDYTIKAKEEKSKELPAGKNIT